MAEKRVPFAVTSTAAYIADHSPVLRNCVSRALRSEGPPTNEQQVLDLLSFDRWDRESVQRYFMKNPECFRVNTTTDGTPDALVDVVSHYLIWLSLQRDKVWGDPYEAWDEFAEEFDFELVLDRVDACSCSAKKRFLFLHCRACGGAGFIEKEVCVALRVHRRSPVERNS